MEEYQEYEKLKQLWKSHIVKVNKERNAVAHSGEFRKKSVAKDVMRHTYKALKAIMDIHGSKAKIKPFEA